MVNSREHILSKIKAVREARNKRITLTKAPLASGLKIPKDDFVEAFRNSLEAVQGSCYIADNQDECVALLRNYLIENGVKYNIFISPSLINSPFKALQKGDSEDLTSIEAGISSCELLVAQSGTAIVNSKEGRKIIALSPIHIIVADRSQLRLTLEEGIKELAVKYGNDLPSQLTLITGPSRTADIEKTLILGAHGPKKLTVFIY